MMKTGDIRYPSKTVHTPDTIRSMVGDRSLNTDEPRADFIVLSTGEPFTFFGLRVSGLLSEVRIKLNQVGNWS
ncbi:MAG: hypothetical protein ACJAWC_002058 [Yoonia sp.]|jgi:hypothetical protein